MSDKGLDEIFRKKLTNREFEFNPANWEAMEAMLDADRKPAVFYWWTSAAVVLFGLLTAGIAIFQNPVLENDIQPISTNIQNENSIPTLEDERESFQNSENSIANEMESSTSNANEHKPDVEQSMAKPNSSDEEEFGIGNNPQEAEAIAAVQGTEETQNAVSANANNQAPSEIREDETEIAFLDLLAKPFPILITVQNNSLIPHRQYPSSDIRKFQKQHEVSMIAGIGAGPSFNGGEESKDWLIGLNYEYRFSFNWSINTSLSYNAKMSPGIVHHSDSIFHSFSPERIITERENKRLDYFELPIQITRSFNSKHQLGLGIYSSVLFSTVTDVKRTSITIKETKESEFSESGLSENFKVFDYGLTSSYSYQFNPSLNLGVQFKYGLSDITVNNTQELNGYHRNISTRLILRYRLF